MFGVTKTGAAVLLLDSDPEQAELTQSRPEGAGEFIAVVDRLGARRDLALGEGSDRAPDHLRGLTEVEVQRGTSELGHGAPIAGTWWRARGRKGVRRRR